MRKKRAQRILAIDPGTREMGYAILDEYDPIYYGVKTLKKKRPTCVLLKETRKIIRRLIEDYNPKILVIEETFFYKHKNAYRLIAMAEEIKRVAKREKLKVFEYAPKTIRKAICKSGKATKREVAEVLCSRYPELHVYLTQDRKWKEKYWGHMFDALALGLTHFLKKRY